ncbi:hypothetical protein J2J97_19505 [Rhizobium bangladeshense]|uniref:hypothetical protein n=1 Tax=Rhizobium bangladeshense TaxID=1138189 RepID=UPI001A97F005|nr:hypothetical protein [Rhizobium bangladeshense]MBX4890423.1 hypothetical protein [Rhizobium bangladeshense]MBX4924048.1 hypothetical protein [Rhizobium bangladeshense]MBX4933443.1 hypothetical protein [Rhizobium bangladeshense]MBY3585228.1 hypothetical protein [Rhizobium bangladeshense]QSY88317.1 hypothetical protein J2J98_19520 [Rhizobium bangladeshense]
MGAAVVMVMLAAADGMADKADAAASFGRAINSSEASRLDHIAPLIVKAETFTAADR